MYHHIAGILRDKSPDEAVIEAGGVGYLLRISLNTYAKLPATGTQTKLFTHLHVAEDALSLIGFATVEEREFFQQLRTVSGVGTTTALAVLSGGEVADLRGAILRGEASVLRRARGVGDKTARRIVLELGRILVRKETTKERVTVKKNAPNDVAAENQIVNETVVSDAAANPIAPPTGVDLELAARLVGKLQEASWEAAMNAVQCAYAELRGGDGVPRPSVQDVVQRALDLVE